MDNKIVFDLKLLELALHKAVEVLQRESTLLTHTNVKPDELDSLSSEKEDIMNFIDWHIPIIVRYIKIHKGDLDDIQDLSNLAIKAKAINEMVQLDMKPKIAMKAVIGNQKVSSITIMSSDNPEKPLLDAIFNNDSEEMPKIITKLLKDMFFELEINFNKLSARKKLNDQVFNLVSKTIKEEQQISYSPKRKKENIHGNLIYNEDC